MRVPGEYGRKGRNGIRLFSVLFFSFTAFLLFSILISCAVFPAAGADGERLTITLIDGEEIYIRSGDCYNFLQDYQVYVKGANSEGNRVWIELRRDNVSLQDDIVGKGGIFVYSTNSTEILNLTVDTIYGGTDGVLVKFSPVYQYLNPKLPMPQKPVTPTASSSDNNSSLPPVLENQVEGFDVPIFILSVGAVFLVTGIFAGIYKKK